MADWKVVFAEDLEQEDGFFDQGASEVTIPRGFHAVWQLVRPEFDRKGKEAGHWEVHGDGRYRGVGFHVFREFRWWLVSQPIDVTPGKKTRAKAALMAGFPAEQAINLASRLHAKATSITEGLPASRAAVQISFPLPSFQTCTLPSSPMAARCFPSGLQATKRAGEAFTWS